MLRLFQRTLENMASPRRSSPWSPLLANHSYHLADFHERETGKNRAPSQKENVFAPVSYLRKTVGIF